MTISCVIGHYCSARALLPGAFVLMLPLASLAMQTVTPVARPSSPLLLGTPSPAVQFQQAVQQQQVRDQLQKSQLQGDLHQGVIEQTKRPLAGDSRNRVQLDQAEQAQRDRDRAAQQDLLDRYQRASPLRPASHAQPATARSSH